MFECSPPEMEKKGTHRGKWEKGSLLLQVLQPAWLERMIIPDLFLFPKFNGVINGTCFEDVDDIKRAVSRGGSWEAWQWRMEKWTPGGFIWRGKLYLYIYCATSPGTFLTHSACCILCKSTYAIMLNWSHCKISAVIQSLQIFSLIAST